MNGLTLIDLAFLALPLLVGVLGIVAFWPLALVFVNRGPHAGIIERERRRDAAWNEAAARLGLPKRSWKPPGGRFQNRRELKGRVEGTAVHLREERTDDLRMVDLWIDGFPSELALQKQGRFSSGHQLGDHAIDQPLFIQGDRATCLALLPTPAGRQLAALPSRHPLGIKLEQGKLWVRLRSWVHDDLVGQLEPLLAARRELVEAAGRIDDLLAQHANDQDLPGDLRRNCLLALAERDGDRARTLAAHLLVAGQDDHDAELCLACAGLVHPTHPDLAVGVTTRFLEDWHQEMVSADFGTDTRRRGEVLVAACEAMALPELEPALIRCLDVPHDRTTIEIIAALAPIGGREAVTALDTLRRGSVRGDVARAADEAIGSILARLGPQEAGALSLSEAPATAGAVSLVAEPQATAEEADTRAPPASPLSEG